MQLGSPDWHAIHRAVPIPTVHRPALWTRGSRTSGRPRRIRRPAESVRHRWTDPAIRSGTGSVAKPGPRPSPGRHPPRTSCPDVDIPAQPDRLTDPVRVRQVYGETRAARTETAPGARTHVIPAHPTEVHHEGKTVGSSWGVPNESGRPGLLPRPKVCGNSHRSGLRRSAMLSLRP